MTNSADTIPAANAGKEAIEGIQNEFQQLEQELSQLLEARPMIEKIIGDLAQEEKENFIAGCKVIADNLETFKTKIAEVQSMLREIAK